MSKPQDITRPPNVPGKPPTDKGGQMLAVKVAKHKAIAQLLAFTPGASIQLMRGLSESDKAAITKRVALLREQAKAQGLSPADCAPSTTKGF